MKTLCKKYAKDLKPGDKINGHEKGWIEILSVKRLHLTDYTEVLYAGNDKPEIIPSHSVFEDVYTEGR